MDAYPDDLGILDPVPLRVTLTSGLAIGVTPLTVRQMVPFVRALGPARDALAELIADPGLDKPDLWDLIADYGEDITDSLSVALSVPRATIDDLCPADYLDCLNAVLEANRDFFASWLLPRMRRTARTEEDADGLTSSSHSSGPVTAAPT